MQVSFLGFRAMAVDSSVMLLLYSIFSGTLGSPGLLLSYSVTTLALHITIILTTTLKSSNFNP